MSTMGVWIASEEVMDKVIMSPILAIVVIELLEAMVTVESVGAVVSITKELNERLSLTTSLLVVTLTVQLSLV